MPTYEPRRFYRQKESDVFDVSLLLKDFQSNTPSHHWHWDRGNNERDRYYKGRYNGNYFRKYNNGPRNRNSYYRQKESFINTTGCSCSTDSRKSENESTQPTSPASHCWSLGDDDNAETFESREHSQVYDTQEPLVPMEDLESTIEWEIKDPTLPDETEKENEESNTIPIVNPEVKEEEILIQPPELSKDKDVKEVREDKEDDNTTETVPVPTPRGFSAAFLRSLGKEVERFAEWSQTTREEQIVREEIFRQVQSKITSLWPVAVVVLFGSSACGLALPCSDVDCVVERLPHIDALISYYIEILSRSLVEIGATNIITAPQARVPLLKFLHPSNLWVDITFKVSNAERSVDLVRGYLTAYPNARPLIMVVKELLRQQGLHSPRYGGLGSYALVLLVVAYLRLLHVYQPSIGCDHYSLGWLLVQFLSYLATHDLQYAFTPGSSEPVQSKSDEDIETRSTFSDSSSNGTSKARAQRLEVRDPLDLKNNVTFSCSNFLLIQVVFGMAVESLKRAGYRNLTQGLLSTFIDINRAESERLQWRNATLNRYNRPINFHYNPINVAPRFAIASNTSGIRR